MFAAATDEAAWIKTQFPRDYVGYALECGAWDGQQGSHTIQLEHAGWAVLCVEPNPNCEPALEAWRSLYRMCAASDHEGTETLHIHLDGEAGYTSLKPQTDHPIWHPERNARWKTVQVPVRTLTSLLNEVKFPQLDLAVIDTEGTELDVLKGLDFERFAPKVVVVEAWDLDNPPRHYLEEKGYEHQGRLGVNDLYVHASHPRAPYA